MKCEKCGAELFSSAKFCHVCGHKIPQKEKPVLTKRLECQHCGGIMDVDETRNVKVCPYCGSKELVEESDSVTKQRIKSHAWKEVQHDKEETKRVIVKEQEVTEMERKKNETRTDAIIWIIVGVMFIVFVIFGSQYIKKKRRQNRGVLPSARSLDFFTQRRNKMGLINAVKKAWNVFNRDPTRYQYDTGPGYSFRPDRVRFSRGNERSIVTSVYNRIALDVAALNIRHVLLDDEKRYKDEVNDGLNTCLSLEANIDQTGRSFIQDAVMSMMDEGCVALVPIETDDDVDLTDSYGILSMRTGKILEWYPRHVLVRVYNAQKGYQEDIKVPKSTVAIIENPLFAVMNEPNSTMQRLIRKLNLLDAIDEQSGSGKLDLIVQLPYTVKSDLKRAQAKERKKELEMQLAGSKYGVAYIDAAEKVTQLNRSVDNNLMSQIEYLTNLLFSQLGITQSILDGTADEKTMLNYYNRSIEPIVSAMVDEMKRKFLTKTARSLNHSIQFFRDPFKLVPVNDIAEIADKFTRNEIMTKNEMRQVIGMKPSDDPKADELRNANLSEPAADRSEQVQPKEENQNGKEEV